MEHFATDLSTVRWAVSNVPRFGNDGYRRGARSGHGPSIGNLILGKHRAHDAIGWLATQITLPARRRLLVGGTSATPCLRDPPCATSMEASRRKGPRSSLACTSARSLVMRQHLRGVWPRPDPPCWRQSHWLRSWGARPYSATTGPVSPHQRSSWRFQTNPSPPNSRPFLRPVRPRSISRRAEPSRTSTPTQQGLPTQPRFSDASRLPTRSTAWARLSFRRPTH